MLLRKHKLVDPLSDRVRTKETINGDFILVPVTRKGGVLGQI